MCTVHFNCIIKHKDIQFPLAQVSWLTWPSLLLKRERWSVIEDRRSVGARLYCVENIALMFSTLQGDMVYIRVHQVRHYSNPCTSSVFFTFMGPCIINVFKKDQQDAMLHNGIYYCLCYTCFRQFFGPSLRSSKLYTQHRIFVEIFLLLTAIVSELELTHDSGKKQKKLDKYPMLCVQF